MPAPSIFISYSHKDEPWKDRLVEHLGILEREKRLRTWNDRRIKAGQEWLPEIETAMNEARVAVLLISTSFLNSEFIRSREVPLLLERRVKEGVHVFPVIVKDCLWEEVDWLSSLQVRPQDGKALETVPAAKRNGELKKIAKEILEILEDQGSPQPATPPAPTPSDNRDALTALLRHRAEGIAREMTEVADVLSESTTDDDQRPRELRALQARFLELHEDHLAAIAAGDMALAHELNGEIQALLASFGASVEAVVSDTTVRWHRWRRGPRYLNTPEIGQDPEWDRIAEDILRLRERTTQRTQAFSYEPGS